MIHDSGALGALLLHHILEESDIESHLVWSGRFLQSFVPLEVGHVELNNGYHVFEYPRSAQIVTSIEQITGVEARIVDKASWVFLAGSLIPHTSELADWPPQVVRILELDDGAVFDGIVTQRIETYLEPFGQRFTDNWETARHLFVPWFFPSDYVENGETADEGDFYRFQVRKKSISGQVASFGNGNMSFLREVLFQKFFPKMAKKPDLISGYSESIDPSTALRDGDRAFTLVVVKLLPGRPRLFGEFDEILIADHRLIPLNRCWFKQFEEESFVVCELYRLSTDTFAPSQLEILIDILSEILKMGRSNFEYVGEKVSRILNVQTLLEAQLWNQNYVIQETEVGLVVRAAQLGTANMNKVWAKAVAASMQVKLWVDESRPD